MAFTSAKQRHRLLLVFASLLLFACSGEKPEPPYTEGHRIVQPINQQWSFALPDTGSAAEIPDKKWKPVSLPHTWNNRDGQDGGDDYRRATGIYRRSLALDESYHGKKLYLHFDGAAINTTVSVNGKLAGSHKGSYGAFRFDISDLVTIGEENQLEVRVSNIPDEQVAPLSADFTFFGGLYRRARLIATNPVHVETMNHASSGVFWSQQEISKERAVLSVSTAIANELPAARSIVLKATLEDRNGVMVASAERAVTIDPGQIQAVEAKLQHENPHLWHGKRDPYLYRATVAIVESGQVLDEVSEFIGLRFFHVDPDLGFFLNGESYPLNGINRMPDFLNKGTAVSRDDHERDIQLMLELGATSVRLGHQQRDPWVYRRTDETGLVVWAEVPLINRIQDGEAFSENVKQQTLELVRQNYNRPSIVIWGLYNEITLKHGPDPRPLVKELNELVKLEDPGRLTSAAVAAEGGLEDSLVTTPDLISFNRYDGWYYGDFRHFGEFLDDMRADAAELRIGVSEYGAGASVEFQTDHPVIQDHSEQYQALYHEAYWETLSQRPWVWGRYIWVLADFAVDNRNEGDTPGRNDKGLVTFDRRIKKDAFYWYKANWSDEPVLYLTDRRHEERTRGQVDIKVYSNLDQVELKVNGKSLDSRSRETLPRLIWTDVQLAMGDNLIEVSGLFDGRIIKDEMRLTRSNSNDTSITSQLLGVDSRSGKIYNAPYGATLAELTSLLKLPEEGSLVVPGNNEQATLSAGVRLQLTAQDGTTRQQYELADAPLSVAKPVWASSEIAGGMSIGPIDMPEMSASMANDGVINSDPDQGILEANIWNTMGGSRHWWKVDLGAEYYIHSVEVVWPQHASMIEQGAMSYSIEVARNFQQTFDSFTESYDEVVDQRANTEAGTTRDQLGVTGRFLKLRLHKSAIFADTPLVGKYPIYGAEEITVTGGLLYSESLSVDYLERTIELPRELTVDEVSTRLQTVEGVSIEIRDGEGAALVGPAPVPAGAVIIARNSDTRLAENYRVR